MTDQIKAGELVDDTRAEFIPDESRAEREAQVRTSDIVPAGPTCPVDEPAPLVVLLHRAITDPNLDVEKLDKLLALKERIDAKEAEAAFLAAKSQFLGKFNEPIPCDKTGQVGNVKFRYASYGQILRHSVRKMAACGLSHTTSPDWEKGILTCTLKHVDGHFETATFPLSTEGQPQKASTDQQQKAHCLTYAERQAFKAVSGVPVADEDVDATRPSPPPTDTEITQFKVKWWDWQKSIGAMSDDTPEADRKQAFTRFAGSLATASDLTEAWSRLATALHTKGSDNVSPQSESGREDHDRRDHHAGGDADSREPDQPGD